MWEEFKEMRGRNTPLYDCKLRGSLIEQAMLSFRTNLANNIFMHARGRLHRLLKHWYPDRKERGKAVSLLLSDNEFPHKEDELWVKLDGGNGLDFRHLKAK